MRHPNDNMVFQDIALFFVASPWLWDGWELQSCRHFTSFAFSMQDFIITQSRQFSQLHSYFSTESPAYHITPSYHLNHSVTGVYLLHMKRQKSKQEIQGNKVQSNVPVYVFRRHESVLLMSGPALCPQETQKWDGSCSDGWTFKSPQPSLVPSDRPHMGLKHFK